MANTLFLRLEGPLQSWGERARWSVRDTAPEPTKSGVVGLIACAMGLKADDDLRQLSRQIRLGVRCDRPGVVLVDYHTVIGGVLSGKGKIKKTASIGKAETVVSRRYYLCDASFLAAIAADPGLIETMAAAVQSPRWPVFLGRRACPPARPIYEGQGDYPSLEAALADRPLRLAGEPRQVQVRAVLEGEPGRGVVRRDEIDSHSSHTFLPRHTRSINLTLTVQPEEALCT